MGIISTLGGLASLLQTPLLTIALNACHGNFFAVNVALLTAQAPLFLLPLYLEKYLNQPIESSSILEPVGMVLSAADAAQSHDTKISASPFTRLTLERSASHIKQSSSLVLEGGSSAVPRQLSGAQLERRGASVRQLSTLLMTRSASKLGAV